MNTWPKPQDRDSSCLQPTQNFSNPIVVVGAGAAGTAFVEEILKSSNSDSLRIEILTKEDIDSPYDRTLISKRFANVPHSKISKNENVKFRSNTEILEIDENKKTIRIKIKEQMSVAKDPVRCLRKG